MAHTIPYMIGGYAVDKMMGGSGMTGLSLGAGLSTGGFGTGGFGALEAGNTTANSLNVGNMLGQGGVKNALGLESAITSQLNNAGEMIPIDFNNTQNFLNKKDFGQDYTTFDSGLTEVGGNTNYKHGDPFYNPQDAFMQNENLINESMFKPINSNTMGISIDDNGVVQHNPTDMELFQPKGTNRELTMQDYAEKGMDKFGEIAGKTGDYLYDNPDKVILGGLSLASMLENNNKSQTQQIAPAGFKQANLSGLTVPNPNGQYVYRPQQTKRRTLLG
tara:strand:+ start:224 stop:1048 length:825 start_codon:yes stop_codon:yes gene_type:complete